MIELLKILLSLSLAGTLLIFVLLLCKPLYKNRLSRQWQYYIWLVVVARLLLPFTPETSLVGNLFREIDSAIVQISTSEPAESRLSPKTDFAERDMSHKNQADTTTKEFSEREKVLVKRVLEASTQNIWLICVLVWLMVAIGLLIRKVTIYQSFVKYINVGRMEVTEMRLWEKLGKLVEQAGVKRTVELYTNSLISSPLLIGFLHPCIMLPTVELSDSDLKNTILHELTHYKRRDMFYKWLVQLAICFHWFNPFVYFMGKEINRACEFSCDEAIIRRFDKRAQRAYGDTLLNAIRAGGNYNNSVVSVMLNENSELLKERLDAIMKFKKTSRFTVAISTVLTCALILGATATGAYAIGISTSDTKLQKSSNISSSNVEIQSKPQTKQQETDLNSYHMQYAEIKDGVKAQAGPFMLLKDKTYTLTAKWNGASSISMSLTRKSDGITSVFTEYTIENNKPISITVTESDRFSFLFINSSGKQIENFKCTISDFDSTAKETVYEIAEDQVIIINEVENGKFPDCQFVLPYPTKCIVNLDWVGNGNPYLSHEQIDMDYGMIRKCWFEMKAGTYQFLRRDDSGGTDFPKNIVGTLTFVVLDSNTTS